MEVFGRKERHGSPPIPNEAPLPVRSSPGRGRIVPRVVENRVIIGLGPVLQEWIRAIRRYGLVVGGARTTRLLSGSPAGTRRSWLPLWSLWAAAHTGVSDDGVVVLIEGRRSGEDGVSIIPLVVPCRKTKSDQS